jgi:hypothetical protein
VRVKAMADLLARDPVVDAKKLALRRQEIRELAMDVPTGYVMMSPGRDRFRQLLAANAASAMRTLLGEIAADLTEIRRDQMPWKDRCEVYPNWHVPAPSLDAKQLAERRRTATFASTALARAAVCARLQSQVLALPEGKRSAFRTELDRCHQDLEAARPTCNRLFDRIEHEDAYAPWRAGQALSNILEVRRPTLTADDVAAVAGRIRPMLDALRPPLSELPAVVAARSALELGDPAQVLYTLSGAIRDLYSPCGSMWGSQSRCVISPSSCEKTPDR